MIEMTFTHKTFGSITLEVPSYTEAHPNTQAYVWNYGLTQCLQDSYATAKDAADFEGKLRKRHDKLMRGEMRIAAQRIVRSELEREMEAIAEAKVRSNAERKKVKLTKESLARYTEDYLNRFYQEVRIEAEENIERRRTAAEEAELPDDFFSDVK